ncbi:MAG: CoA transferase [Pseudolabrys sp.]
MAPADTFLARTLVVELGQRTAAAAAGSLLAELGATVVFVEVEPADRIAGKLRHRATWAAGKLSLCFDPASAADVDALADVLGKADVVLMSSDCDPQWPDKIRKLTQATPIVTDVGAFGDSGPYAGRNWSDGLMQAITGALDVTGEVGMAPTATRAPVLELGAGLYAAIGVLLALGVRRRDGVGQNVQVALFDCAVGMLSTFLPKYFAGGQSSRIGNHHPSMSPWNSYRARDGWLLLCAGSNDQWHRICKLVERPELANDARYATPTDRVRANPEIDRLIDEWARQRSVNECIDALNSVSIPCGPVIAVHDLFGDAGLAHRHMFTQLVDPHSAADVHIPGATIHGTRATSVTAERIPAIDADRDALRGISGFAKDTKSAAPAKAKAALDGLRVLEIGQYTTAPLAARQMGAFGADVVKIEPAAGEPARALPPHREQQGYFFTLSNSDKRAITIDFRNEDDRALFAELVKRADVLIENLKPGALERFGFGPAELDELNPRLVYCAVSGFGRDSPYNNRLGMDTTIQGMSGIMDLTQEGGIPFKTGISISDIVGGIIGMAAILAALEYRARTGRGQFIDISMQDATTWLTRTTWNDAEARPPLELVTCSDGWVAVSTANAGLASVAETINQLPANPTREEAIKALAQLGLMAAPVLSVSEVSQHPQTKERQLIVTGRRSDGMEWPLLATPVRLSHTPGHVRHAIGALNGDRDEVLADWGVTKAAARRPRSAVS